MPSPTRRIVLAAAVVSLAPLPAHAYIDPATGTILIQGLIAAIAGGLAFVRIKWEWIKSRFQGARATPEESPANAPRDDQPPS